jgi:hypothetical protein
MLVTELGIETEVIFDHANALSPILLIDGSITKFPVHPLSFVIDAAGISTEYVPPAHWKLTTSAFATLIDDAISVVVNKNTVMTLFMLKTLSQKTTSLKGIL